MMKSCRLLIISILISGCQSVEPDTSSSTPVKNGDTVFVHYVGKVIDGEIFEMTLDAEPRGIIVGAQQTLPAFEQALIGMRAGESKNFDLPHEQAFGPYLEQPGMTHTLQRSSLAHTINPKIGQQLNAAVFLPGQQTDQSQIVPVFVTAVTEQTITVDANHPLAGKNLNFDVTVVEIQPGG